MELSLSVVREMLEKALMTGSQKDPRMIADVIIDNLADTDKGISQLVMAFLGVRESTWWKPGDECLVKPAVIYGWGIEKDEMQKQGMYVKDMIKAKITAIDMTKKRQVTVLFEALEKDSSAPGGHKTKTSSENVRIEDLVADPDITVPREGIADML